MVGTKQKSHSFEVEGIAVTLEVPEGLPPDPRHLGDWDDPSSPEGTVKVYTSRIEASRVETLERAQYHATLAARSKTWVRGEQRDDGWAVTNAEPDKTSIEAVTYRRSGEWFVRCKASRRTEDPMPDHSASRALLESICDSLAIVGPASPTR